jgi:hypothetical protein
VMERTESEETLEEGAHIVKISLQSPRPQALTSSKRVDLSRRYQQLRDELAREHDSKGTERSHDDDKKGIAKPKRRDKRPSSASSSPKLTSISSKSHSSSSGEPKETKLIRRVKRGVIPTHEDGREEQDRSGRHDTSAWTPPKLKSYENVHGQKVAVLETNLVKARGVGSPTQILTEIPGKPRESSPSSNPSKRRVRKEKDQSPIAEKPSLYINISIGDGRVCARCYHLHCIQAVDSLILTDTHSYYHSHCRLDKSEFEMGTMHINWRRLLCEHFIWIDQTWGK